MTTPLIHKIKINKIIYLLFYYIFYLLFYIYYTSFYKSKQSIIPYLWCVFSDFSNKCSDIFFHIFIRIFQLGFKLTTLVVIGTDYTGSCKSNYHTITTMTTPLIHKIKINKIIYLLFYYSLRFPPPIKLIITK
jgi:hypothetical protein